MKRSRPFTLILNRQINRSFGSGFKLVDSKPSAVEPDFTLAHAWQLFKLSANARPPAPRPPQLLTHLLMEARKFALMESTPINHGPHAPHLLDQFRRVLLCRAHRA